MPTRKPYMFLCGTPREHCGGSFTTTNAGLRGNAANKSHNQPEQAFACHAKYLVNVLGYKQLGPRDFQDPTTGEVRVLTKQSRFGGKLRNGKEGTRNMPHVRGHRGGARGGIINSY